MFLDWKAKKSEYFNLVKYMDNSYYDCDTEEQEEFMSFEEGDFFEGFDGYLEEEPFVPEYE